MGAVLVVEGGEEETAVVGEVITGVEGGTMTRVGVEENMSNTEELLGATSVLLVNAGVLLGITGLLVRAGIGALDVRSGVASKTDVVDSVIISSEVTLELAMAVTLELATAVSLGLAVEVTRSGAATEEELWAETERVRRAQMNSNVRRAIMYRQVEWGREAPVYGPL